MPPKPVTNPGNAINMKDVTTATSATGEVVVTLDNPCTVHLPDLVYARAQLTAAYSDVTAPVPVSLAVGTLLKVASVTKGMTSCTVRLTGPGNEILNGAKVLLFFASFENAR